MRAEAALVEAHIANDDLPLQLHFYNNENDDWRGNMFTLAFYTEKSDMDLADFSRVVFLNFVAPRQGRPLHLNACAR